MAEVTEAERVDSSDEEAVPRRADGVLLHGEYEGSGYTDPRYLIARSDGQMVLVSELLYRVTEAIDGHRNARDVAEEINRHTGKQISAAGVSYLVEDKLRPLGIATMSELAEKPPQADPLISLALRGVLAPARFVRPLAAVLSPLFLPVVIALVLGSLVVVDAWLVSNGYIDTGFHQSVGDPTYMLALLALLIGGTIFHEFGHAAGCHYGGARPGAIGVGIMIIYPCFYTNVTDAYRLDRRGRLRTDLGGVYFNMIFILGLAALYATTHYPPLVVAIAFGHLQILQQLLPLIRMDGYYILGDLVGIPNLFAQVRPLLQRLTGRHQRTSQAIPGLRPRVQVIVTVWVLVVVPTLCAAVVLLLTKLPQYLATAIMRAQRYWEAGVASFGQGHTAVGMVAILSMVILILPWVGGTALAIRTFRKVTSSYLRRRQRKQPAARHRKPAGAPRDARISAPS
jgi:putative peptide zinc metalloprotease protein